MRKVKRLRAVGIRTVGQAMGERFEFYCVRCGDRSPMYTLNGAALVFRETWRSIIELVESGKLHTAEPETGEIFVCGHSLAEVFKTAPADCDHRARQT